jgi:hypothetical protein
MHGTERIDTEEITEKFLEVSRKYASVRART